MMEGDYAALLKALNGYLAGKPYPPEVELPGGMVLVTPSGCVDAPRFTLESDLERRVKRSRAALDLVYRGLDALAEVPGREEKAAAMRKALEEVG